MRKVLFLSFISFIIFFFASAETLTIVTYYPSPFGAYRTLTWGDYPNTRGMLKPDQGSSIELGGSGTPYIDFSNDMTTDYDARIVLTGDNTLDVKGVNRMDTCVLVNYPVPGVCPKCYFVGEFLAKASGKMLCCRVSNPVGTGCPQ